MNSNTHPANLDIVKTKIQRWTQDQIKSVDDDVEDHIKQIRESNSTFDIFTIAARRRTNSIYIPPHQMNFRILYHTHTHTHTHMIPREN